jgi:hypothetical protein
MSQSNVLSSPERIHQEELFAVLPFVIIPLAALILISTSLGAVVLIVLSPIGTLGIPCCRKCDSVRKIAAHSMFERAFID